MTNPLHSFNFDHKPIDFTGNVLHPYYPSVYTKKMINAAWQKHYETAVSCPICLATIPKIKNSVYPLIRDMLIVTTTWITLATVATWAGYRLYKRLL